MILCQWLLNAGAFMYMGYGRSVLINRDLQCEKGISEFTWQLQCLHSTICGFMNSCNRMETSYTRVYPQRTASEEAWRKNSWYSKWNQMKMRIFCSRSALYLMPQWCLEAWEITLLHFQGQGSWAWRVQVVPSHPMVRWGPFSYKSLLPDPS